MKPAYLYHGSQYKFDIVKPHKASGNRQCDSYEAIYAYEKFEDVIPFALPIRWYPDEPKGKLSFHTNDGKTFIEYGSLNPNGKGYVYKMDASSFRKIEDGQYISSVSITPVEVYEIKVCDYWNTITFSTEALFIQKKLYGTIAWNK